MDDDVTERYFLGDDRLFIVEKHAATGDLCFFTSIVIERWRSMMLKLSRHKQDTIENAPSSPTNDDDGVSRHFQTIKNLIDATEEEIHSCATFTKLSLLNAIEILKS